MALSESRIEEEMHSTATEADPVRKLRLAALVPVENTILATAIAETCSAYQVYIDSRAIYSMWFALAL